MPVRRVFISATTADLGSCRREVAQQVRRRSYEAVEQDVFVTTFGDIDAKLDEIVGRCDAAIFLVGFRYGAEPPAPPAGEPRRSYTQLEYEFAARRGLPSVLFLADPALPCDPCESEADELRQLQQAYCERLARSGRDAPTFRSLDHLLRLVAELRFPWEPPPETHLKPNNLPASIGSLFKGRDAFLAELRDRFEKAGGGAAAITQRGAIHGLGGVGKTRTAIEYAWRFERDYHALLLVQADTPENLRTNLARLTGVLAVDLPAAEEQTDEARLRAVLDWLTRHPRWLLIFDNVDTPEAAAAAQEQLNILARAQGHVLLTSRIASWRAGVDSLELDVLAEADAVAFLLDRTARRSKRPTDAADAREIARDLDGLALALEQAGAYVNAVGLSLGEYRVEWRSGDADVRAWHDETATDYPRSVAVTWATTAEQLSGPARVLLEMLAFVAADPIPRSFITSEETRSCFEAAGVSKPKLSLAELLKFSLVAPDRGEDSAVRIHRLVQEVTRDRLPVGDRRGRAEAILRALDAAFPGEPSDVRHWPAAESLAAHVQAAADRADGERIAEPTARLMCRLGDYFRSRAGFAAAEPLLRRAAAISEAALGPEHPEVGSILNNLAHLLEETGRPAAAEPLYRRALAIGEQTLGPDHPDVAARLNNLAMVLRDTGRAAEAEPLFRQALLVTEAALGPDHPRVALRLNNLALLLRSTGRFEEAESLFRRAIAIDEAAYGADRPDVATPLNNLALLLWDAGRPAEAEPLFRRAVAVYETALGPDHPYVARCLTNLGRLLRDMRRPGDAEPLLRRAVETLRRSKEANGQINPLWWDEATREHRLSLADSGQSADKPAAS